MTNKKSEQKKGTKKKEDKKPPEIKKKAPPQKPKTTREEPSSSQGPMKMIPKPSQSQPEGEPPQRSPRKRDEPPASTSVSPANKHTKANSPKKIWKAKESQPKKKTADQPAPPVGKTPLIEIPDSPKSKNTQTVSPRVSKAATQTDVNVKVTTTQESQTDTELQEQYNQDIPINELMRDDGIEEDTNSSLQPSPKSDRRKIPSPRRLATPQKEDSPKSASSSDSLVQGYTKALAENNKTEIDLYDRAFGDTNKTGWCKDMYEKYRKTRKIYLQMHEKLQKKETEVDERLAKAIEAEEKANKLAADKQSVPNKVTSLVSKASLKANELAPPARVVLDPQVSGSPAPPRPYRSPFRAQ